MNANPWRTGWRIAAAVIFIALAARFVLVASTTETGWGLVRVTWHDAALDWAGLEHEVMYYAPQARQAEFLLAETDRVLAENPNSAELAIGAAWMLDAPGEGPSKSPSAAPWKGAAVDSILTRREHGSGWRPPVNACTERSASLAEQLTRTEPQNVSAWRTQHMLPSGDWFIGTGGAAPPDDAPDLDNAALHDPHNAFYDYVAAVMLWDASCSAGYSDIHWLPQEKLSSVVGNRDRFEQGLARFQRAQSKPLLTVEHRAIASVGEFLEQTPLPRHEHAAFQLDRRVDSRGRWLLRRIAAWHSLRIHEFLQNGNVEEAWRLVTELARVTTQLDTARDLVGYGHWQSPYGPNFVVDTHDLADEVIAQDVRAAIPAGELASVRSLNDLAQARRIALQGLSTPSGPPATRGILAAVLATGALEVFLLACAVGACCLFLSRLVARFASSTVELELGWRWHLLAWAAAASVTVYFWALCAGGIIFEPEQEIIIFSALIGLPVAMVAASTTRTGHFGLRTLFAIMAVLGLALALAQSPSFADTTSRTINRWLVVLPRSAEFHDFGYWRKRLELDSGDWRWAALEWDARDGARWTVLLAVATVALLSARRAAKRTVRAPQARWQQTTRVAFTASISCVGRSAMALAIVALLVYLAIAPLNVADVERHHVARLAELRDPELLWTRVDREAQAWLSARQPRAATPPRGID